MSSATRSYRGRIIAPQCKYTPSDISPVSSSESVLAPAQAAGGGGGWRGAAVVGPAPLSAQFSTRHGRSETQSDNNDDDQASLS